MPRIKKSLQELVGKTIKNIVICKNSESEPKGQLFLVFDDGTSFEFWANHDLFSMASKVDDEDLDKVVELAEGRYGTVVQVIESPLAILGNDRVESEPAAATNNPLDTIPLLSITEEHALFLAIHRRDAFLYRLAREMDLTEQRSWVDLISAAFGNLLGRCDFESMFEGCNTHPKWKSIVRPPSVLPAELMQFLGGLSVVNSSVYALVEGRAAVQAFMDHFGTGFLEAGRRQGQSVLRNLRAANM